MTGKTKLKKLIKQAKNWRDNLGFKVKLSLLGTNALMKRWPYLIVFIVSWYIVLYILSFFRDGSGNWALIWSSLSLGRKMQIVGRVGAEVWQNFGSLYGLSLVALAFLQALVVMHLAYSIRHREQKQMREGAIDGVSTGSAGAIIGFVALGCPSCGITMMTPMLTAIAGAGAVAAAEALSRIFIFVAFLLLFATIVRLGYLNFLSIYSRGKNAKDN